MGIIPILKHWFAKRTQSYSSLMGTVTNFFWMIDFVIDMAINLPDKVYDVFVADIAQCCDEIPLEGNDNLMNAISKLILFAYQQKRIDHPGSEQRLWVLRFDEGKYKAPLLNSGLFAFLTCTNLSKVAMHVLLMRTLHLLKLNSHNLSRLVPPLYSPPPSAHA